MYLLHFITISITLYHILHQLGIYQTHYITYNRSHTYLGGDFVKTCRLSHYYRISPPLYDNVSYLVGLC